MRKLICVLLICLLCGGLTLALTEETGWVPDFGTPVPPRDSGWMEENQAAYQQALDELAAGEIRSAMRILMRLGTYADAEELLLRHGAAYVRTLMEAGEKDVAEAFLSRYPQVSLEEETPVPTEKPTPDPTPAPTPEPTAEPTAGPTPVPTAYVPQRQEDFLRDLTAALNARWAIVAETDTVTMTRKEYVAWLRSCVDAELALLDGYMSIPFQDDALGEVIYIYMQGLYSQQDALELFDTNPDVFSEYWDAKGYDRRCQAIYLLNWNWGLPDIDPERAEVFRDVIAYGKAVDQSVRSDADLNAILRGTGQWRRNNAAE